MRLALVLAVLTPALAMAQDEGTRLAEPTAGVRDVVPGGPMAVAEARARWRSLGYVEYSSDQREMIHAARRQTRVRLGAHVRARRAVRLAHPYSFRIEPFWTITPRAVNALGPYDGNDGYSGYVGGGLGVTGSKWLTGVLRMNVRVAVAYITGDVYIEGDHGPEATIGAALTLHSSGRKRMGVGLGVDMVVASEWDAATNGHFRWLGVRGVVVAEMAFVTRRGRTLVSTMSPTLTWAPYANHPYPGLVTSLSVELPRGREALPVIVVQ